MDFIETDYKKRTSAWSMSALQSHNHYELYFLLEGKRRFFLKDRIFEITAPTVCVVPPFCMHKTEGGAHRKININFSPDIINNEERNMLDELGKTVVFTPDASKSELLLKLLDTLTDKEAESAGRAVLEPFLHVILYLFKHNKLLPYEEVKSESKDDLIMKIVSYIHETFREEFTIKDLCERFYVSKNTLCSRFKRVMGCSVMEYRQLVRINRAKVLLVSTRRDMKSIAEECGFSSANYFSLIFKEEVGISPLNYRKTK